MTDTRPGSIQVGAAGPFQLWVNLPDRASGIELPGPSRGNWRMVWWLIQHHDHVVIHHPGLHRRTERCHSCGFRFDTHQDRRTLQPDGPPYHPACADLLITIRDLNDLTSHVLTTDPWTPPDANQHRAITRLNRIRTGDHPHPMPLPTAQAPHR